MDSEQSANLNVDLKKKRKKRDVIAITLLVAACFVWAYFSVIAPSVSYQKAEQFCSNGDFLSAIAAYEKLDGYKDSKEKLRAAITAYADNLLESGEYQTALEYYERVASSSREKMKECHYRLMLGAIEGCDWERAYEEYSGAIGYRDTLDKFPAITIGRAEKLIEEKDYLAAERLLRSIEEEPIALKNKVKYLLSLDYFEGSNGRDQDFAKAAYGFSQLIKEENYANEAKEKLYLSAVQLCEDVSNKALATHCFALLGDYENAKEYAANAAEGVSVPLTLESVQGTWQCVEAGQYLITLSINGSSASVSNYDMETGESGFFWDCDGANCIVQVFAANTNGYLNPQIMVNEVDSGMNQACILIRKMTSSYFTTANSGTFYKIG